MTFEKDYIQKYLDQIWPGWVISRKLGAGTYGSVYKIYREDIGTGSIDHHLVCALKVLFMEAPAQNNGAGTSKTVQMPGWENRQRKIYDWGDGDISETPPFFTEKGQHEGEEPTFPAASPLLSHNVSDTMLEEFIRNVSVEINTMVGLKGHPNIVSIEDYSIKKNDQFCMIMIRMEKLECLAGSVLEGRQVMSKEETARLGIDICKALELCERKNLIHRDIKPSNIFFSDQTGFKLGDFGISRTMDSIYDSASMSGVGTPRYMAPEIYTGQKYNNTADIYSLGVVLYQLLNDSYLPFIRENLAAKGEKRERESFIRRMRGEPLPAPARADDQLASIILKACSYSPEDRYSTAADLRNALEQYLSEEKQNLPKQNFTRKKRVSAAAGILAAIVIFVMGFSWSHLTSKKEERSADANAALPAADSTSIESADADTGGKVSTEEGAATSTATNDTANEELTFADSALEKAIRQYLKMTDDEPLTRERALHITEMELSGGGKDFQDKISDLYGLSAFENLEILDLQKNRIADIEELSSLKKLEKVKLESNLVSDLTPLSGLENLRTLEAAYNRIDDLTPVYSLKNLTLLEVIGNQITSIEGIGSLDKLRTLRIGENQLTDIRPVAELDDLTCLGFGYNDIEDVSILYEVPGLHYLTMSYNRIHNIDPVLEMKELKWLETTGNPIDDKTVFDHLPESVKHLEK